MPKLVTWMNNQRVGELTKLANGAHTFSMHRVVSKPLCQTVVTSLPLAEGNITSDAVFTSSITCTR
ncbi:protein hipA [Escherichia coli]|uniref:Protein hipA n=1 Tax=Escherichia coli TaxID=562 RepID=A0A377BL18_ECOLX|nr:protein hipA [Escherichia coli]